MTADISNLRSMLKNTKYLLVDNKVSLELCINNGLNKSTKIISFNPYLVLDKKYNILSPEKNISTNFLQD